MADTEVNPNKMTEGEAGAKVISTIIESDNLKPMKPAANGLRCGIYASAETISNVLLSGVDMCPVKNKYHQRDVFDKMWEIAQSDHFVASMEQLNHEVYFNADDPDDLSQTYDISEGTMIELMAAYLETYHDLPRDKWSLGVVYMHSDVNGINREVKRWSTSSPLAAVADHIFLIHQVNGNHWEGYSRIRDVNDVSTDGSILSPSKIQRSHDPRFAGPSQLLPYITKHQANHSAQECRDLLNQQAQAEAVAVNNPGFLKTEKNKAKRIKQQARKKAAKLAGVEVKKPEGEFKPQSDEAASDDIKTSTEKTTDNEPPFTEVSTANKSDAEQQTDAKKQTDVEVFEELEETSDEEAAVKAKAQAKKRKAAAEKKQVAKKEFKDAKKAVKAAKTDGEKASAKRKVQELKDAAKSKTREKLAALKSVRQSNAATTKEHEKLLKSFAHGKGESTRYPTLHLAKEPKTPMTPKFYIDEDDESDSDSSVSSLSSIEPEADETGDNAPLRYIEHLPTYERVIEDPDSVPNDAELIALRQVWHNDPAFREIRKNYICPAQIMTEGEDLIPHYPKDQQRIWDGTDLTLSINCQKLAPSLRLTATTSRGNDKSLHIGHADFFFGAVHGEVGFEDGQYQFKEYRGVRDFTYRFGKNNAYCEFSWMTQKGTQTNLKRSVNTNRKLKSFRTSENILLSLLRSLCRPSDEGQKVIVRIKLTDQDKSSIADGVDYPVGEIIKTIPDAKNIGPDPRPPPETKSLADESAENKEQGFITDWDTPPNATGEGVSDPKQKLEDVADPEQKPEDVADPKDGAGDSSSLKEKPDVESSSDSDSDRESKKSHQGEESDRESESESDSDADSDISWFDTDSEADPEVETEESKPTGPERAMRKPIFYPYMTASGKPRTQFGMLKMPKTLIEAGHSWLLMQAVAVWIDERHAEIVLSYGCHTTHLENARTIQALNRNQHTIKLFQIGGQVFALVKWKVKPQLGYDGELFKIEEGQEVDIKVFGTTKKPKQAKCFVIANQFGFKDANMVLIVRDKDKSYFEGMLNTWPSDEMNVDEFNAEVTAEINTSVVRAQMDAVARMYEPTHQQGNKGKYLPLLCYDGDKEPDHVDPYLSAHDEKDREAAERKWKKFMKNDAEWNRDQKQSLKATRSMPFGIQLMKGPGGTGKTFVALKYSAFVARNDFKVFIGTQNNYVLDHIAIEYVELCCQGKNASPKPLRMAASSLSGVDNFNAANEEVNTAEVTPKDMTLLQTFLSLKNEYTTRRRRLADLSVEQAVEDYVSTNSPNKEPLMAQYMKKAEAGGVEADGDAVDMRSEFARYLPKLKTTPFNARDEEKNPLWDEDDRRKARQAYHHCRDEVIRQAPIIIGTVYSTSSREYACFSEQPITGDHKATKIKGIYYMLDEAPTVVEASALIPLAIPQWSKQIIAVLMFGDLAQLPPLVIGGRFNVFQNQLSMSLYKRLVWIGIKEHAFTEQKRIHPMILPAVNAIFYSNLLVSPENASWPKFLKGFADTTKQCFQLKADTKLSEGQLRLAYLEINGTEVRKSTETGSSANYETYFLGLDIVKKFHGLFKADMNKKLAIISPYRRQLQLYREALYQLKEQENWTDEELPRLLTADSSQGQESPHTIVDLVINDINAQGFVGDPRRQCTALSRAKFCQWVIGAALDKKQSGKWNDKAEFDDIDDPEEAVRKGLTLHSYKKALSRENQVHVIEKVRHPLFREIAPDLLNENDEDEEVDKNEQPATDASTADKSTPDNGISDFKPDEGTSDFKPDEGTDDFKPDDGTSDFKPDTTMASSSGWVFNTASTDIGFTPDTSKGAVQANLTTQDWGDSGKTEADDEQLVLKKQFVDSGDVEEEDEDEVEDDQGADEKGPPPGIYEY